MNQLLERYVDPAYIYRFSQNPNSVRSRQDAIQYGINCVSLAHLALKDLFDYQLPPELDCFELYTDKEHLQPVANLAEMQTGDFVWFGWPNPKTKPEDFIPIYRDGQLLNWTDFPVNHVAIFSGDVMEDYMLLHANHIDCTNAIWPLARFSQYERYRKLYGINRLRNAAGYGTSRIPSRHRFSCVD